MRFDFMIVDVFTDVAFGGNQLAVLTDARGLTGEAMQAITREFDFPETTFLLPPKDPRNARAVRIFTPGRELPFAGHPTVGTACALAMSGACEAGEIILEEGVGPIPVATTKSGRSYSGRFRLERAPEVPDQVPSHADMAAVLSLEPGEIVDVFGAGMGVDFTFVQVADRAAVDRSALDHQAWRRVLADQWGTQVHVFAGELERRLGDLCADVRAGVRDRRRRGDGQRRRGDRRGRGVARRFVAQARHPAGREDGTAEPDPNLGHGRRRAIAGN